MIKTLQEYVIWSRSSRRKGTPEEDWENAAYGFGNEVGELMGIVKKEKFHDFEENRNATVKELGDALFYAVWGLDLAYPDYVLDDLASEGCRPGQGVDVADLQMCFASLLIHGSWILGANETKPHSMFYSHNTSTMDFVMPIYAIGKIGSLLIPGLSLLQIAQANQKKLVERYPDGFSPERSKNRKEYNGGLYIEPSNFT